MTSPLEFYFDFSCPYAYLASTQIEGLASRTGADLVPRPVLLGGVFRARGVAQNLAGTLSPAKAKHNMEDLTRWADRFGVPLNFPEGHPRRTVTALRCLLAVGEPFMPLVHRFYDAYWGMGADLSDEVVVAQVLSAAGHDPEEVLQRAQQQDTKDDLRQRTEQGIAAGLFGVPGCVIDGDLYWGQDRLNEVERALGGTVDAPPLASEGLGKIAPTDLWFDYSSPFAYLAVCRAPALFGEALRLRPMLLGAVFKMVDAPNVPLLAMNEAKRAWITADLALQADTAGLSLRWPSGFPLRTVLPLRMTLLVLEDAPDRAAAFVASVFAALWQEDASPEDADLMASLAEAAGFDGQALVAEASTERAKALLRTETSAAVAAGVFGAPGIVVHGDEGPALFWGNDRLELAREAALR